MQPRSTAVSATANERTNEHAADPVAWVDSIIGDAVMRRASDLHIEPFRDELRVRMRIDGVLEETRPPSNVRAREVTSRIKVLARLNISEQRVPQDGHLSWSCADRTVDVRVSTLPTVFGESVVLRVLDRARIRHSLDTLGMAAEDLARLRQCLAQPHGLVVVAGPTGSGKTTTLYSALASMDSSTRKILTIEDPVEFKTDGLIQVSLDEAAGLGFASALRSFLRQDPDVILVGEIRDEVTARVAVQAALTGHLVLTSVHAPSAAGALTRLLDLGVEPFLLSSALQGVIAQRMVRRRCSSCGGQNDQVDGFHPRVDSTGAGETAPRADCGGPCQICTGTGFAGRLALFESIVVDAVVRNRIVERPSTTALEGVFRALGVPSLRDAGLQAVRAGLTTLDEVIRRT